jgi:hypothetical protein
LKAREEGDRASVAKVTCVVAAWPVHDGAVPVLPPARPALAND